MTITATHPHHQHDRDDNAAVNKEADRRFAEEVMDQHRLDLLPELVVEDFVEVNPLPGQGPGRDGLRDILQSMFDGFPDLRWTVHDIVAEGDQVASFSTWSGTHQGEFMGIPATGRPVEVEAWTMDRFRDGKLAESRILMDVMGLLTQLGVIPAPEPAR